MGANRAHTAASLAAEVVKFEFSNPNSRALTGFPRDRKASLTVRVPERNQFARELMKRIRRGMGHIDVDVLGTEHLRTLVDDHATEVRNVLRFAEHD